MLEIDRRRLEPGQRDVDGLRDTVDRFAREQCRGEVVGVPPVRDAGADRDDRHRLGRGQGLDGRGLVAGPGVDDQVRVVAAEAERAHRGPAQARPVVALGE